ncbi:hypothetical protein OG782_00175 [Streptomyces sp. NBC_00876]|uniref:hypothetical protein n=1 Tax=Streptomyces sp. NBC_00876 TaxID=2975853 RepID=UPI00386E2D39|nr:hypothetical protein OG782_00175 [Streptomyces sp. NBC_00876]
MGKPAKPMLDASGWTFQDLGRQVTGPSAWLRDSDGELRLYTCDADSGLLSYSQWSGQDCESWRLLQEEDARGGITAAETGSGWELVFAGADGRIRSAEIGQYYDDTHYSQAAVNAAPQALVALAKDGDDQFHLIYQGDDGAVWRVARSEVPVGRWKTPERFAGGGGIVSLDLACQENERLVAFATNPNGELYTADEGADGQWGEFEQLPAQVDGPAAAAVNNGGVGTVAVFYKGTDPHQWYRPRTDMKTWGQETSLGGSIVPGPTPFNGPDGRLATLVVADDASVWINQQTSPGSLTWDDYVRIGENVTGPLSVHRNHDGLIRFAYTSTTNGNLWVATQV